MKKPWRDTTARRLLRKMFGDPRTETNQLTKDRRFRARRRRLLAITKRSRRINRRR